MGTGFRLSRLTRFASLSRRRFFASLGTVQVDEANLQPFLLVTKSEFELSSRKTCS